MKLFSRLLGASALLALAATSPAHALTIHFNDVNDVQHTNAAAYAGFNAAKRFWESQLTNDVTVNLNIGFANLGSTSIIGQTASTRFTGAFVSDVYGQLAATGTSALDQIAVANLTPLTTVNTPFGPTGAVAAITQKAKANGQGVVQNGRTAISLNGLETSNNREYDADGSRNNYDLWTNGAVLKALGFDLPDAIYSAANRDAQGHGIDGKVTFNSTFAFDFDPTNGIGAGRIDFIGTAIHEFGHALGFVSGVDVYDTNSNIAANLDNLQGLMSTLDLFRYSDDVFNLAPGAGQALDWSVGNSATATNLLNGRPYFSFDGHTKGLSAYGGNAGYFSTGQTFGDRSQASHWMDTPYVALAGNGPGTQCLAPVTPSRGVMDPTAAGCEDSFITSLDMAAFDAMGWNLSYNVLTHVNRVFSSADALTGNNLSLPEPSTWAVMIGGFGLMGATLRRRRLVAARV